MRRRVVPVEVIEHRGERLAAVELLRGLGALALHVDEEVGVLGEERFLPVGVAAIRAVSVGVEELPDSEAVSRLGRCDLGVRHLLCPGPREGPSHAAPEGDHASEMAAVGRTRTADGGDRDRLDLFVFPLAAAAR